MLFKEAKRVENLPPYLFARIEQLIDQKRREGVDVISLGIGDPDLPTPGYIVTEAQRRVADPVNHQYPSSVGLLAYREAVSAWYGERFGVSLDPQREVVSLIGSKEGIAHLPWCYLDPGDIALIPDPGYPVYSQGTILAGGEPYYFTLPPENGYRPDFAAIPPEVAQKAKMMFLNYPNNPTGATADLDLFTAAVDFARKYEILIIHDLAYSEIYYDNVRPPSLLQVPGANDVAVELHSVSKTYNMTGWRAGWAVGNAGAVAALGRLKTNIDSGIFQAVQYAVIAALRGPQEGVADLRRMYQARRDLVVGTLNDLGWDLALPQAAFYIWAPVPEGHTSSSFAEDVLEKTGVVITPGTGYGKHGEGFFRLSLTVPDARLQEAMRRWREKLGSVRF